MVGTARRIERLADLAERFPTQFLAVRQDIRDVESAPHVIDAALQRFGAVDVLVNNAGVGQVGAAEEITDEQLRDMLSQHLFGPAAMVRAALPSMRERGTGAIVQLSSQGGRRSFPGVGSLRRLVFLTRMRLSGMSMGDLRRYIALVDQGASTTAARCAMMLAHRERIRGQLRELQLSLAATEYKILAYGGAPDDENLA